MQDLNDYGYFAAVVAHGGFAAAGRALRIPKSRLSRRIAAFEVRLGARLIERSTRRFQVTEVGQAVYERCRTILVEAEQAETLVAEAQAEPRGRVRFSCPTGMAEIISPSLPAFLARYSTVTLQMIAVDRPVDLIGERIDVALRVRGTLDTDAALTMRTLGRSRRYLVASPRLASGISGDLEDLAKMATLGSSDAAGEVTWELVGPGGAVRRIRHEPRLSCEDFAVLRENAVGGAGVALIPDHLCQPDIDARRLVRIYPDWHGTEGIVHLVFTTRRGLPPAVRVFIDHLAAVFRTGS